MLKILLCDDNERILESNKLLIEKALKKNNINGKVVYAATSPHDVLFYCSKEKVDVVIVDIDLKSDINGLALAQEIRKADKSVYIVFITGHLEYLMQAYKVKTFDYLPKPVSYEAIEQCIISLYEDYAAANTPEGQETYISLRAGNEIFKIRPDDITYIERVGSKTVIHMHTSQVSCYDTLESLQEILGPDFLRCYKSFIVNKAEISVIRINKNEIVLKSGVTLSIGRKYKKEVINYGRTGSIDCS